MIYHSKMSFKIEIIIPAGARLIGTRTKGNKVMAVCEFVKPKIQQPRPNGLLDLQYMTPAKNKMNYAVHE